MGRRRLVSGRGLLPLQRGERPRLRPGVHRDPPDLHGEQPRGSCGRVGGLQGPHGQVLLRRQRLQPHRLPNYEVDELFEISKVMSRDLDYEMTDEAGDVFKKYIERRMAMPFFSNARTVRNAMDRARMNAAIRVFDQAIAGANGGDVGAEDLKAITADDFQVILDEALAAEDDAILA